MSFKILAPTYFNRLRKTKKHIGSGKRLLNIGCGDGEYNRHLYDRFESITGLDINRNDLFTARANSPGNSRYVLADGRRVPFQDRSFDAVLCIDTLEHVEHAEKIVSEAGRVLEKGGQLVLSVPNRNYPITFDPVNRILHLLSGRHIPIGMWGFGHLRLYSLGQTERLLKQNGFRIEEVEHLNHHLAGLFEGYLSTLFSGAVKSDKANQARGGRPMISARREPPAFLKKLIEAVLRLDEWMFRGSKTSVGILIKAEKIN